MRVLFSNLQRDLSEKMIFTLIITAIFTLLGVLFPFAFYKYIDNRELIKVRSLSYNKKTFSPCEEFTAIYTYTATLDAEVEIQSRLYKIIDGKKNLISSSRPMKEFINKTPPEGDQLIVQATLPCTFPEGVYQQQGIVTYKVRGEIRTTGFLGAVTTVQRETNGE